VPKLADEDEFLARQQAGINGADTPQGGYTGEVTEMPETFNSWAQANAGRIEQTSTTPYFIRDNKGLIQNAAKPKETPLQAALRQNIAELEKKLGVKRGEPMSFEAANERRGNPNYGKGEQYSVNCQTCVVANELRRRGFDVQALGNTKGSTLEALSHHTEWAWLDDKGNIPESLNAGLQAVKRKRWDGMEYMAYEATCRNRKQLVREFEAGLTEDGRYHVKWTWDKERSGHIITAERIDGTVRYYDPQSGKVISDFVAYLDGMKVKRGIQYLRVDNLRVNPDVAKKVLSNPTTGMKSGKAATGGTSAKLREIPASECNIALPNGGRVSTPESRLAKCLALKKVDS